MIHYYYLHVNGDLISKPAAVVDGDPEYFNSPLVRKVWRIETESRADAWKVILESLALGGDLERVKGLAEFWGCTIEDLVEYMVRNPEPDEIKKIGLERFLEGICHVDADDFFDWMLDHCVGKMLDELDFSTLPRARSEQC